MTDEKGTRTVDIIVSGIEDWKKNNPPSLIAARVKEVLDKGRDQVIVKLAGFDNRWFDRWEIDHCNARRTAIDDYVKRIAQDAVDQWIADNVTDLPTMTGAMKKAITEDYKNHYERHLGSLILEYAERKAEEDAEELIRTTLDEMGEPKYLNLSSDEEGDVFWSGD